MLMAKVDIWLIIGGRRWAQLLATELFKLLPSRKKIHIVKDNDTENSTDWLNDDNFKNRIKIVKKPTPCQTGKIGIAFIINSAYLHKSTIQSTLLLGYNVIVEKPLTFSLKESIQQLNLASQLGLKIFTTNTYQFASYLSIFKERYLHQNKIDQIYINWSDNAGKIRYGQIKKFDSSVPIIFDVIPHIASIIFSILGEVNLNYADLTFYKGGSKVKLKFTCDNLIIHADISRNSKTRARILKLANKTTEFKIDFTKEPGVVSINNSEKINADNNWHLKRKPIAEMLNSVWMFFEKDKIDNRLLPDSALLANVMIDLLVQSYVMHQIDFFKKNRRLSKQSADIKYARKEIDSIKKRTLKFLPNDSPLQEFANIYND